jgi:hypothetical protein
MALGDRGPCSVQRTVDNTGKIFAGLSSARAPASSASAGLKVAVSFPALFATLKRLRRVPA